MVIIISIFKTLNEKEKKEEKKIKRFLDYLGVGT
jgi:hypothetical protein